MSPRGSHAVDFSELWRDVASRPEGRRWQEEDDLAFWRAHVRDYDSRGGQPAPATTARLREIIAPGASVLDIGCGTGRFALTLAGHGCHVTGLDHSPDMLARAAARAQETRVTLRLVRAAWPTTMSERYDVALAAWSLYRQADLTLAVNAMAACARTVIAVDVAGVPGTLASSAGGILGRPIRTPEPRASLLHGAMTQAGLEAEVGVIAEPRDCRLDVLAREEGWELTEDEVVALQAGLADWQVAPDAYRDHRSIGVVVGRSPEAERARSLGGRPSTA